MMPSYYEELGFALARNVLSPTQCSEIVTLLPTHTYIIRDVLTKYPQIVNFLDRKEILGEHSVKHIRRSVLFTKPSTANWRVPWHQDVLVQVADSKNATQTGPFYYKEGIPHIQPPVSVMEEVTSIRIHLTNCNREDGPLRVKPGTHLNGYRDFSGITNFDDNEAETIICSAGDILFFSPLLLHSSLPTTSGHPRMVLHLEVSKTSLPSPHQWRHGS